MTPQRFRACLKALSWSQADLARQTGYSAAWTVLVARGDRPVPGDIAAWLEARVRHAEATPAPVRAE